MLVVSEYRGIWNNFWQVIPPALKAAEPVGPQTCTEFLF
jgi:hypothetical protein